MPGHREGAHQTLYTRSPLYISALEVAVSNTLPIKLTVAHDLLLVLRVMTFVMACLIVVPAFSMSFFDSAEVTHTLRAGTGAQPPSLAFIAFSSGRTFSRVIRTPLARACRLESVTLSQ